MSDLVKTEELEQLKEIMEDEFGMLIDLFIEDSAKLLKDMITANSNQDAEALRIAAHTLKGSSANMCAPGLSDLSQEIEDKAKDNDFSGIAELIESLLTVHRQVTEILKDF